MHHRGPDAAGEWWSDDKHVGFGHRRLAIIDLSTAGQQPMIDPETQLCIVFNGEIYNFLELRAELETKGIRFRTRSDTEVILAAYREWGDDCLSRLNGMFAFALYDARRRRLVLARDRAGEKPLFYWQHDTGIAFASELKALMAAPGFPRRLDPEALDCFLAEGYVAGDACILQGVRKLPPAHVLVFDLKSGTSRVTRYWELPECITAPPDEGDLVDELEALLEDAVRKQLVADVPVGVLLSGGVDSSLITAMAVRAREGVRTFTVRFPGHGRYDETEHARLIARHFGTEHVELVGEPGSVSMLPLLARQFDEPVIDSSMIPTCLLSRLVRQHCTVAVGGDGADELFGGYSHYDRLLWLESRFASFPAGLRSVFAKGAAKLPIGFKGRNWLQALATDFQRDVPLIASYFDKSARARLLGAHQRCIGAAERRRSLRLSQCSDLLQRATRSDFQSYLVEDILVKVDRASMLNSLEVRAPMLDYRVVEFAFGKVPSSLKAGVGRRKILLKKLAARLLPPEFDQHRKQGFSIPLSSWLQSGPWLDYFRQVLLDPGQTLFRHGFLQALFDGQGRGRSNGERLFGLVMFELWRREYRVEL